jgi:hypothetical protein
MQYSPIQLLLLLLLVFLFLLLLLLPLRLQQNTVAAAARAVANRPLADTGAVPGPQRTSLRGLLQQLP